MTYDRILLGHSHRGQVLRVLVVNPRHVYAGHVVILVMQSDGYVNLPYANYFQLVRILDEPKFRENLL